MENDLIVALIIGIAGLILGVANSFILYFQYNKDKPNIKIEKIRRSSKIPKVNKSTQAGIRVCIKNLGYKKAYLNKIIVYVKRKDKEDFATAVNNIDPKIPLIIPELEQREINVLFSLGSKDSSVELKKLNPIKIYIRFEFLHKSITLPFLIGKKGLRIQRKKYE
jgi:hypothetical protein